MRLLAVTLLLMTSLAGCAGTDPDNLRPWESPVENNGDARRVPARDYGSKLEEGKPYRVVKGDTLYSIAFRLGIDFRELAARNNISAPYVIKVGQLLRTAKSVNPDSTPNARLPRKATKVPPTPATNKSNKSAQKQTKTTPVTKPSSKTSTSSAKVQPSKFVSRWRWPSTGKVVRMYSSNRHKGIDIAGKRGDPVRAVAAGRVVYAGTGVTGYGSLLIVKHNDTYLSAYGHNEQLLVSENMNIEAGQQIATMGSSGTDSVKLHFELRRRGKPIDPLTLLPTRR